MLAIAGEHHRLDVVRQVGEERLDPINGDIVDGVALVRARKIENGNGVAALGAQRIRQLCMEAALRFCCAHGAPPGHFLSIF